MLFIIGFDLFFVYEQQVDDFYERKEYVQQVVIEQEYKITNRLFHESVTDITYTYMSNQLFNLNTFVIYIRLTLAMAIMYVSLTRRRSPISSTPSST